MTYPVFPYGVNMTLIKRTVSGVDEYGNDVYAETPMVIGNCVFQPAGSTENLIFTDQVNDTDTIFMPYGTPVEPVDAIEYQGVRYEVIGTISSWVSPFSGRTSPIRVNVSKVTGVSV